MLFFFLLVKFLCKNVISNLLTQVPLKSNDRYSGRSSRTYVWVRCPDDPNSREPSKAGGEHKHESEEVSNHNEEDIDDDDDDEDNGNAEGELSHEADVLEAVEDIAEEAEAYADALNAVSGKKNSSSGENGGEGYLRWWERGGNGGGLDDGPFGVGSSPLGGGPWDARLAWWAMVGLSDLTPESASAFYDSAGNHGGGDGDYDSGIGVGGGNLGLAVAAELGEEFAVGLARNVGRFAKATAMSYFASAKGIAHLHDKAERTMADPKVSLLVAVPSYPSSPPFFHFLVTYNEFLKVILCQFIFL
jgi:hypothetical protein